MILFKILLLPFATLFKLVTSTRNKLFDLGLKPSVKFDLPVICVGNLTVGGTGKTPMVEYLMKLSITNNFKPATLSRGYGRRTKGMRVATKMDDALTLGDEPYQFYKKFSGRVVVVVGEDRALAIPTIIHQFPETGVVLLDDAYQHRYVRPSFTILLTDYSRLFYNDYLLPMGRLRESRKEASRADVVVVTKCPEKISAVEMAAVEKCIKKYSDKKVFFTKIKYGQPMPFSTTTGSIATRVILLSGIANPTPFETFVNSRYGLVKHVRFKDHHNYTISDLQGVLKIVHDNPGASVLTTEKDMVKLDNEAFKAITSLLSLFYLPIETEFLKSGEDFDKMVLRILTTPDDK